MKIYSFFSGDTVFLAKSKNLRKAQAVGRGGYKLYLATCEYLDEEPQVGSGYFVPQAGDICEESLEWARHLVATVDDVMVLDDDLETLLTQKGNEQ